jgi:hypothetical protein
MTTPAFLPRGNFVGFNSADNGQSTSSVVANRTGSVLERLTDLEDQAERAVVTGAALLVTGTTVFTVTGGPIHIFNLLSICMVGSDSTAATLQWSADGTVGAATTFTAASASRANQLAGDMIVCNFTALSTAPDLVTAGVGLGPVLTRGIIVPAGIITTTIGSGPTTTGTYKHYLRYRPLGTGITVTAAF